jgi:LPXTG-site transpeptidase (sortase) family protein
LIFFGLLILAIPTYFNIKKSLIEYQVTKNFTENSLKLSKAQKAEIKKAAQKQNENPTSKENADLLKKYNQTLIKSYGITNQADIKKLGPVIATIVIPKISVNLPVFNGTSEFQLSKGAGLMNTTSLPMGGSGIHTVITAHNGDPTSTFFTNLNQLKKNDYFYTKTAYGKYWYKVDQIKTVTPEELSDIQIVPNKNYTTLVTCTPYMINSHRLLVRGHLTDAPKTLKTTKPINWVGIGVSIMTAIILTTLIIIKAKRKKQLRRS